MSTSNATELRRLMTAYDNSHESKPILNYKVNVYGVIIPFVVVSHICVILRIYTRIKLKCLGWDDLFVVLVRVTATVGSIFLCLALNNGFGEHILMLRYDTIVAFQKYFYICLATYTISTTLVKLCLLSQYLRIFEAGSRARGICWVGLGVCALWGAAFSFCALFPCFPVSGFWDWLAPQPARCYGFGSKVPAELAGTFAGHTASNAVLNALVLAIPVPLYFRKSTAWKQRLGIGILLFLGLIVNLLSIWRLRTIVANKAGTYPVLDLTWYTPTSIIVAALEVDLASICASIPTFWPALRRSFLNAIFITREVHVTHQHRRLSSSCSSTASWPPNPPPPPPPGLQLTFLRDEDEDSYDSDGDGGSLSRMKASKQEQQKRQKKQQQQHGGHYRDDFMLHRVVPANMLETDRAKWNDVEACGGSQVRSEGHRGFKRERERLQLAVMDSSTINNDGSDKNTYINSKTKKIGL
ncbi:uncharacterized protein F4812DRAFT_176978 [Daldinia caldariorum]|uniref:uncharacterized protein n=1 Tax=Daldinia caldariorum TaxID=326644 RepID=UPI002007301E|nr:uncharacterized protein F4812DRAFT_176978 [Daldinia caldariorum]KAI1471384.1 hypothetical protein F4812DRAFT_176978 [Daldinia caldariorum]